MKKFFLVATVVVAALASCKKESVDATPASEPVDLFVGIEGTETRATGVAGDETDEAKVNTLQVFVFNGEKVDGMNKVSGSKTLTVSCTAGSRDIYAIVNAADLTDVTTKTEFLAKVSQLGNTVSNFEMIGSKTETLTSSSSVTIPVDRFAARVVVKKVTNALSSPTLAAQTFKVENIHLINVAADINYAKSQTYSVATWYNKMALQAANKIDEIITDAPMATVAHNASYSTQHYFYAYPNDADHSHTITWSPRRTMLVLKVRIGEVLYDYPIILPVLESNKSYEIAEVKITRPGNPDDGEEGGEDEQKPVVGSDCSFTITVNNWTVVPVTDGTTI